MLRAGEIQPGPRSHAVQRAGAFRGGHAGGSDGRGGAVGGDIRWRNGALLPISPQPVLKSLLTWVKMQIHILEQPIAHRYAARGGAEFDSGHLKIIRRRQGGILGSSSILYSWRWEAAGDN